MVFVPNETTGDMRQQRLVSKADIHPWDLVCMAMIMCPFLAAHCCTRGIHAEGLSLQD